MTPPVRILQMLLAALFTVSLASISPALAIENPGPVCCCQTDDTCKEPSPQSHCACTGCPPSLHTQPLAIVAEKNRTPPAPAFTSRWNSHHERAAERRSAPPVPPPRIPA